MKICICLIGIPVALLQEDGKFSNNSYLIRNDLTRPLKDFTLCVRLSLNYLRGERNYWLSIGNATQDSLLTGGKNNSEIDSDKLHFQIIVLTVWKFVSCYLAVFDNGKKGPRIIVKKFHPEIEDSISIDFERFDFQSWHHYCFVFSQVAQFPYPGGYVNLTNKAYVDGVLVNEGMKMELE